MFIIAKQRLGVAAEKAKPNLCQCGCGQKVKLGNQFILGHNSKGKHLSEKTRRKISESNQGSKNPMFGKCCSKETKKRMSLAQKGKVFSKEHKRKLSIVSKGRIFTDEHKKNLSLSRIGKHLSEETKRKISLIHKGSRRSEEVKKKMSIAHTGLLAGWKHPMYGKHHSKKTIKKMLCRRIPSSLETKFQEIIDRHNLPYRFVGDGSFIIGHYNPDFININGEKTAVEVYARYYKNRHIDSIETWKQKRAKIFRDFGRELLFFDETQVNDKCVLEVLCK